MMRAVWVALLVAVPNLAAASETQSASERAALADLQAFHGLINRYRAGEAAAVRDLSTWEPERILAMHVYLESAGDTTRPWDRARFQAAVMLHTDAALLLLDKGAGEQGFFHVDAAGRLLKRASKRLDVQQFTSAWYLAVARVLRDRNELLIADRHLELGRDRLPNDVRVLYESGTLAELFATDNRLPSAPPPMWGGPAAVRRRDTWSSATFDRLRQRRALHLNHAAGWLRESMSRSRHDPIVRLHLGRVQMLRKEDGEAARLLAEAASGEDAALSYLAEMFTGALHERRNRIDDAAAAYQRAIERFPAGQAACVALSAVLQRLQRGEEARDVLRRATSGARKEPWWFYFYEPPGVAGERLDLLRSEVRR